QIFYRDADGDGHGVTDDTIEACWAPEGYVANKGDCNDHAANIHPGAKEDCTVDIDMNCDDSTAYADMDGDGFPACDDCDDNDPAVNPGAVEICDGIDNDCDGKVDTDDLPLGELCGSVAHGTPACVAESGCVVASCEPNYYDPNGD